MSDIERERPDGMPEEEFGGLGIVEILYGVLFSPKAFYGRIADRPPLAKAFLIFVVVSVVTAVLSVLLPVDLSGVAPELGNILNTGSAYVTLMAVLISVGFWLLPAGVIQLFSELFGGRGSARGTLVVLFLANIPRLLAVPFQVIAYLARDTAAGPLLTAVVSLLVFAWEIALLIIGLTQTQRFSAGRALAVLLISFGLIVTFSALLTVIGASVFVKALGGS